MGFINQNSPWCSGSAFFKLLPSKQNTYEEMQLERDGFKQNPLTFANNLLGAGATHFCKVRPCPLQSFFEWQ
jgi:hypothetical protein